MATATTAIQPLSQRDKPTIDAVLTYARTLGNGTDLILTGLLAGRSYEQISIELDVPVEPLRARVTSLRCSLRS